MLQKLIHLVLSIVIYVSGLVCYNALLTVNTRPASEVQGWPFVWVIISVVLCAQTAMTLGKLMTRVGDVASARRRLALLVAFVSLIYIIAAVVWKLADQHIINETNNVWDLVFMIVAMLIIALPYTGLITLSYVVLPLVYIIKVGLYLEDRFNFFSNFGDLVGEFLANHAEIVG